MAPPLPNIVQWPAQEPAKPKLEYATAASAPKARERAVQDVAAPDVAAFRRKTPGPIDIASQTPVKLQPQMTVPAMAARATARRTSAQPDAAAPDAPPAQGASRKRSSRCQRVRRRPRRASLYRREIWQRASRCRRTEPSRRRRREKWRERRKCKWQRRGEWEIRRRPAARDRFPHPSTWPRQAARKRERRDRRAASRSEACVRATQRPPLSRQARTRRRSSPARDSRRVSRPKRFFRARRSTRCI